MIAILKLIIIYFLLVLLWCAITGAIAFLKDIHRYKSELEFSGSRRDFIKFLSEKENTKENLNNE